MPTDPKPYPKTKQLARGERRYRRHVASAKQWKAIIEAKAGRCRVCNEVFLNQYHHLVPRSLGGDDKRDNIVPLCIECHDDVTCGRENARRTLAASLSDAEYTYVIEKMGEGALERLFGVEYRP